MYSNFFTYFLHHLIGLNKNKFVRVISCLCCSVAEFMLAASEDKSSLRFYDRDKLLLTRFLGSGAFGEVFEGKAKEIVSPDTVTLVAVKVRLVVLFLCSCGALPAYLKCLQYVKKLSDLSLFVFSFLCVVF